MRRTHSPIVKEEVLTGTIWTDEGEDLPIEIEYEYAKLSDLFGDFSFAVTVFGWTILGKTRTPKDIIQNQVEQIIKEKHNWLPVEFNY
jgi:hypothetical protein